MTRVIRYAAAMVLMALMTAVGRSANTPDVDIVSYLNNNTKGQVTVIAPDQLIERLKPENGDPNNGVPKKAVSSGLSHSGILRQQCHCQTRGTGEGAKHHFALSADASLHWLQSAVVAPSCGRFPHPRRSGRNAQAVEKGFPCLFERADYCC